MPACGVDYDLFNVFDKHILQRYDKELKESIQLKSNDTDNIVDADMRNADEDIGRNNSKTRSEKKRNDELYLKDNLDRKPVNDIASMTNSSIDSSSDEDEGISMKSNECSPREHYRERKITNIYQSGYIFRSNEKQKKYDQKPFDLSEKNKYRQSSNGSGILVNVVKSIDANGVVIGKKVFFEEEKYKTGRKSHQNNFSWNSSFNPTYFKREKLSPAVKHGQYGSRINSFSPQLGKNQAHTTKDSYKNTIIPRYSPNISPKLSPKSILDNNKIKNHPSPIRKTFSNENMKRSKNHPSPIRKTFSSENMKRSLRNSGLPSNIKNDSSTPLRRKAPSSPLSIVTRDNHNRHHSLKNDLNKLNKELDERDLSSLLLKTTKSKSRSMDGKVKLEDKITSVKPTYVNSGKSSGKYGRFADNKLEDLLTGLRKYNQKKTEGKVENKSCVPDTKIKSSDKCKIDHKKNAGETKFLDLTKFQFSNDTNKTINYVKSKEETDNMNCIPLSNSQQFFEGNLNTSITEMSGDLNLDSNLNETNSFELNKNEVMIDSKNLDSSEMTKNDTRLSNEESYSDDMSKGNDLKLSKPESLLSPKRDISISPHTTSESKVENLESSKEDSKISPYTISDGELEPSKSPKEEDKISQNLSFERKMKRPSFETPLTEKSSTSTQSFLYTMMVKQYIFQNDFKGIYNDMKESAARTDALHAEIHNMSKMFSNHKTKIEDQEEGDDDIISHDENDDKELFKKYETFGEDKDEITSPMRNESRVNGYDLSKMVEESLSRLGNVLGSITDDNINDENIRKQHT